MIDYQTTLHKLNANLNTLRERESKYAGDAPIALLNEISDHRGAIELTEQLRADRIFLRRVGGGYIFIHRYLMEYFASLTEKDIERLSAEIEAGKA